MSKNILILIDIQKEYTLPGRPFYLHGIEPSLDNCRKILNFARERKWEIVHVQHSNGIGAPKFDPETECYQFVSGFEPLATEKHFVKNDYSCYSSKDFASYMEEMAAQSNNIYYIGYNSVMCCLSTAEEARRRKHVLNYVTDASYAKSLPNFSEAATHKFMLELYAAKKLVNLVLTTSIVVE
jgi:nicotinamidase-related amidase